jgi:hypothetical protein
MYIYDIHPRHKGDASMTITKHGRFFALHDTGGELIAITVYKKGAQEIIRRLNAAEAFGVTSVAPHVNGGRARTRVNGSQTDVDRRERTLQ